MISEQRPVVICGGGVSGLSLAFRLWERKIPFRLFEATSRFGGNIHTAQHDGFLYDLGPDSFLRTKPDAAELCRELGLGDELISPQEGGEQVYVVKDGVLVPMPAGLSLGVPRRPGPILTTPLLSPWARLRALFEPFISPAGKKGEESIAQFLSRRLGPEMAQELAGPLLSGVFAGDANALSMDAAFPQLVALEKKYGSLFSGLSGGKSVWEVLRQPLAPVVSPFLSLRGGLSQLVNALIAALPAEYLIKETPVLSLRMVGRDVQVQTSGGLHDAGHVCVAGPPWAAAQLLGPLHQRLANRLPRIRGFPTATVFFGFEKKQLQSELSGSGLIAPPGEAEILAATFISSKWPHRAPQGKALVRAFLGGSRQDISHTGNEELVSIAERELKALLGDFGKPEFHRVHRYEKGTPQPELGHRERLADIFAEVDALPWLSLIGSGYGAVGIPDCIRQGKQVAEQISNNQ